MTEPVVGAPGALIVIISGPSGVGKDTIIRTLRRQHPDETRHFVVTYKTRSPRRGEIAGVDYQFVNVDEFLRLLVEGELLEASEVHGHWSGTPRDQVAQALVEGRDAILKIDVQGAEKIKAIVPDALRIFVAPPSAEDRRQRLAGRATETPEEQEQRNLDAEHEMAHMDDYDYVVINETGRVEQTAHQIDEIIRAEHALRSDRRIVI
ncbi:MAG TPA: guanylate kinase [Candidatus Caenarcaniphilales bacterium]|nr:guanylate kinase [Candidatus Caenarcaniphilales bacterium]